MLTDTKLRNLRPGDKLYKVNDRDGLYVAVTPGRSSWSIYNKVEYAEQRRHMLQEWVNLVEAWSGGQD